jgi:hypothetical protein
MYARRSYAFLETESASRLYVTRLESGSIIAEIAPYAVILGGLVATMGEANTIGEFARRLWSSIKVFSDPAALSSATDLEVLPSESDVTDIRAFLRPLTGKPNAALRIRHARYEKRDGDRHTVLEYAFEEAELNRAAVNIDEALSNGGKILRLTADGVDDSDSQAMLREAMLIFEQASRKPGKERGRTGDRGVVPDVSSKALPVYFRHSFQSLKDQMVRGDANPLTNNAFVVDVFVMRSAEGEPKAYYVTNVHRVIPLGTAV